MNFTVGDYVGWRFQPSGSDHVAELLNHRATFPIAQLIKVRDERPSADDRDTSAYTKHGVNDGVCLLNAQSQAG